MDATEKPNSAADGAGVGDRVILRPGARRDPDGPSPIGYVRELDGTDARVEWDDGNAYVWNPRVALERAGRHE